MKKQKKNHLNLNAEIRATALYEIWQILSLIDREKLSPEYSAIVSCAMSRAWEAGSIDFTN